MAGNTVGYATLPIIPSMRDVGPAIIGGLKGPANKAGREAGASAGGLFSSSFGKAIGVIGGYLAATFAIGRVKDFFVAAIGGASDLSEAGTAVGEVFGESFGTIDSWAKKADSALGQSTLEALNAAKTFGVYGQSAGLAGEANASFSTGLAGLATDLASFHNTSPQDAITAIGSALRGEMEPIRAFGVLLDDASLRNEALKLGLIETTKNALTPQQRVLAVQSALYAQTTVAQGDFTRTSAGLANQNRIAAATWENVSAKIGTVFLPAVTSVVSMVNTNLLPALSDGADNLEGNLGGAIGFVTDMLESGGFTAAFETIGGVLADQVWPAVTNVAGALYTASQTLGISAWDLLGVAVGIVADVFVAVAPYILTASEYLADNEGLVLGIVAAYATWRTITVIVGAITAAQAAYAAASYGAAGASYANASATGIAALAARGAALAVGIQSSALWLGVTAYGATNRAIVTNSSLTLGTKVALLASAAATGIVTVAQWAWNAAMTANPIGIIIVAIAALVGGIIWLATQTTFFQDLWSTATAAIGTAANWLWVNAIKPAFDGIGTVVTWLWESVIQPVVSFISTAFTWLMTNVVNPLRLGFLITFGIIAGIITWWWNTVLAPAFAGVGAIFTWLWEAIISPVFAAIGAIFTWLWQTIIMPVFGFIVGYFTMLGTIATWLWTNAIMPAINGIGAVFTWLWANAISPAFAAIGVAFNWVWNSVVLPVSNFISGAIKKIGSTVNTVFSGIGKFIGNAFTTALSLAKGPINGIISLVNSAIRGINGLSVTIPDWVPEVGGQTWGLNIPTIPNLATGGTILPRSGGTIVNLAEAGSAETVTDLGLTNRQMAATAALAEAAMGDLGDGGTVQHVTEIIRLQVDGRTIAETLREYDRSLK